MSNEQQGLSVARNLKIALFHLGSGMADVLTTGVWNRIMISDLGISATPVSLLVSLRYFLAPMGVWAGRVSDTQRFLGMRRLFWIWLGRAMMVLSTFGLGFGTAQIVEHGGSAQISDWLWIVISLVLFSFGNAISGTTFLALIYDRSLESQRGRSVGIVWTVLLLGFTVGGILFSILLPHNEADGGIGFSSGTLFQMFAIAGFIFLSLWFFPLLGEEKRSNEPLADAEAEEQRSIRADMALVWQNSTMRFFLFYLSLSMFFAFSQDAILEPFAGDVFGMSASVTNRFAAYWGTTSILGSVLFIWLSRKYPKLNNTVMSLWGVVAIIATFALLTFASVMNTPALMTPSLLLLGIGLGMWNIGTLGLMMDLSPVGRAGTFLGFWSMVVTLARGGGVTTGGIMRDLGLQISGSPEIAYAIAFGGATIGMIVALWCLNHIQMQTFKSQQANDEARTTTILAGSMD